MKNFINTFSIEKLKSNIINIIFRFGIPVIIIFVVSWLFFSLLHWEFTEIIDEKLTKIIVTLIITFFFSVWVHITSESNNFSKIKNYLFQLIPLGFWILLYNVFSIDFTNFENILFIFTSFFGIFFYLFFAPYLKNILKNNLKQSAFYTYFYNISVLFLISFILWGVLFGLWGIWITSVFALFDLRNLISDKIYQDWAILALSFITPLFALTGIPEKKSFNENNFNENAFFSFLIKYIAIPFIYVYFIILYAYTIKVLSNFGDWPKGEVSWIVIGFSIFGYIIYIFSYIFEEKNKFIKSFRKFFPFVVIPQIFMLFYAIYLRIAQYDITINRYLVVVFGIWLFTISLYYIFSKKKYLAIIPFLLTTFTIIISIWPWSVHELPENRQLDRLENNLTLAWILKDWIITPLENFENIDKELSTNIYSGIEYLCDFNKCSAIKNLFPLIYKKIEEKDKIEWTKNKEDNIKNYKEAIVKYAETDRERVKDNEKILKRTLEEKYEWVNSWKIITEITKKIKVQQYNSNLNENLLNKSIYISIDSSEWIFPIEIQGYSKILRLENNNNVSEDEYWNINILKEQIEIIKNREIIEIINIKNELNEILTKYENSLITTFSKKDLTFEITSNNKTYKVIFENLDLQNPKYKWWPDDNLYYYANWYLLMR